MTGDREGRVIGFGYHQGATLDSLALLLDELEARFGPVKCLAAAHSKRALVEALGEARGLSVIEVADSQLPEAATLTHSAASIAARGTGSVAEAVALLAAGPGAQLLGPRTIARDRHATAAVAQHGLPELTTFCQE